MGRVGFGPTHRFQKGVTAPRRSPTRPPAQTLFLEPCPGFEPGLRGPHPLVLTTDTITASYSWWGRRDSNSLTVSRTGLQPATALQLDRSPMKLFSSGPPSCCYAEDLSSTFGSLPPTPALRPEEDAEASVWVPSRRQQCVPRKTQSPCPVRSGLACLLPTS